MKVSVGVSARHVHLNKETFQKLFNQPDLTPLRTLDQKTQFAASEKVTIKVGEKEIPNVRIIGPLRNYNQIEISKTDSFKLKVNPPIKSSGDLEGSLPITIIGPNGKVDLEKGLILANRHIHINKEDLKKYNLKETDKIAIKVDGEKGGIMKNIHLKVQEDASLRLHLDTDDANAFNLKDNDEVEVLKER